MKSSHSYIIICLMLAFTMTICLTSCKTNKADSPETQAPDTPAANIPLQEQANSNAQETPKIDELTDPSDSIDPTELPANALPSYEYPGDDPLQTAIIKYLIQEFGKHFAAADVRIPSMTIVATDTSNPEDIRVWGDFWIFNYRLDNDTLITESGGSHPGLIHLKKTDDGYKVTKMDVVADGADNLKSAKEIFGDKYEDFHEINSNQDEREKTRRQFISDYVKANKLSITKVKDFGWDPIELP